jgi:hypothetical protein
LKGRGLLIAASFESGTRRWRSIQIEYYTSGKKLRLIKGSRERDEPFGVDARMMNVR